MDFAQYLLVKWYMENKIKTAVEVGFSLFSFRRILGKFALF